MADWLSRMFGSKISVPSYNAVNLGTEQQKAINYNELALPSAEALTSKTNAFSQDETTKMLERAIPGYSDIASTQSKDIASMLKGEIPDDVSSAVQRSGAARSLGGGYGGSGMGNSLVARDLGLTSLNLIDKGLSSAESWTKTMNSIYSPGQANVSSMFITPQQEYQADEQQTENSWNRDYLQAQSEASADPRVSGLWNMLSGSGSSSGGM